MNMNHPQLLLPYYVTPGSVLPSTVGGDAVVWHSSLPGVIREDGTLAAPQEEIGPEFQLSAATSNNTYTFRVRMLGNGSRWLAGYTRKPNENLNIYSLFVAGSLHLALDREGENGFEALNSNYGVLFAKADYSRYVHGETKMLRMPRIFRLLDGGFGILALPLDYEGNIDRLGELLYFETGDFVHYEEKGRFALTGSAVLDYSCELDAGTLQYRIGWRDESGEYYYVTTEDFIHFDHAQPGEMYPVKRQELETQGAETGQLIALTSSEALYLRNKLGRIRNVSVEVPPIAVETGAGHFNLNSIRATARYSDGTVSGKRVAVDHSEWAALDLSKEGTYSLKGKVIRSSFPYPMMRTRPDPQILRHKGRYYFIATDDDGQRRIYIRSADTLEGLEDGRNEEILLWDGSIPNGERHGEHWAPELHVIGGKMYCFLAISVNNKWHGVQAHVAELLGDDPMNPEHWGTPRRVLDRHGKVLSDLAEREMSISLDMTYFEHIGKSYVCWSQPKWHGEVQERASLYIATVDPEEPWRLTSDAVRICRNEYGWDRNGDVASGVSEGPHVLKHGDRLYMVFSGSNVGPRYTVGVLEMAASGNPLNPADWRKSNYPWMHSLGIPGQFGPGHNAFVQDEFGDWYNVYHACGVDGGWRDASIRPVHFRFDGSPVLDMRDEEELLPELEQVTVTIVVK
ncbi:Extracellular exo-alpha-(1-_5)-L-arabinofuranosidase precursor [compost metagenome]